MVTSGPNNVTIQRTSITNMTTLNLALDITKRLMACGVMIIALPGGFVQLIGKYGSVFLTHDVSALSARHLDQLCGDAA
jgi:hypothetical protein